MAPTYLVSHPLSAFLPTTRARQRAVGALQGNSHAIKGRIYVHAQCTNQWLLLWAWGDKDADWMT